MKVKVVYEYRSEGMHGFTTSFLPEQCEIVNVRRYLFSSYGYDLIHDGKNIGHFIEMSVNDDKKNYTEEPWDETYIDCFEDDVENESWA